MKKIPPPKYKLTKSQKVLLGTLIPIALLGIGGAGVGIGWYIWHSKNEQSTSASKSISASISGNLRTKATISVELFNGASWEDVSTPIGWNKSESSTTHEFTRLYPAATTDENVTISLAKGNTLTLNVPSGYNAGQPYFKGHQEGGFTVGVDPQEQSYIQLEGENGYDVFNKSFNIIYPASSCDWIVVKNNITDDKGRIYFDTPQQSGVINNIEIQFAASIQEGCNFAYISTFRIAPPTISVSLIGSIVADIDPSNEDPATNFAKAWIRLDCAQGSRWVENHNFSGVLSGVGAGKLSFPGQAPETTSEGKLALFIHGVGQEGAVKLALTDQMTGITIDINFFVEPNPAYGPYNWDGTNWDGYGGIGTLALKVTSSNTATIERSLGYTATNLVIPNEVLNPTDKKTYKITAISDSAFLSSPIVGRLELNDELVNIGDSAFYKCDGLTTISIKDRTTTIGNKAFYQCKKLNSLSIPNSVLSLGNSSFSGCTDLQSISIGNSVKNIGDYAFYHCSSFNVNLSIGRGVKTIGSNAFDGCSNFTGPLTIPSSVTTIGDSAFAGCANFTGALSISDSVETIGNNVFNGDEKLETVTIGTNLKSIGYDAFYGCSGLYSSLFAADKKISMDQHNVFYIRNNTTYYCLGQWSNFQNSGDAPIDLEHIQAGTKIICDNAFFNYTTASHFFIPNGVVYIGKSAFENCTTIQSDQETLKFPSSVVSIGDNAFNTCNRFKALEISNVLTAIGNRAFYNCNGILQITFFNFASAPSWVGDNIFFLSASSLPPSGKVICSGGAWAAADALAYAKQKGLPSNWTN